MTKIEATKAMIDAAFNALPPDASGTIGEGEMQRVLEAALNAPTYSVEPRRIGESRQICPEVKYSSYVLSQDELNDWFLQRMIDKLFDEASLDLIIGKPFFDADGAGPYVIMADEPNAVYPVKIETRIDNDVDIGGGSTIKHVAYVKITTLP